MAATAATTKTTTTTQTFAQHTHLLLAAFTAASGELNTNEPSFKLNQAAMPEESKRMATKKKVYKSPITLAPALPIPPTLWHARQPVGNLEIGISLDFYFMTARTDIWRYV